MPGIQANSLNSTSIASPVGATSANLAKNQKRAEAMAKDFEALFLSQIIKGMRQSLEPGSMFAGDSGDVQGGLFDQYMGKHLAEAGGVGLAATIKRQMAQRESDIHADTTTRGTGGTVPRTPGA